MRGLDTIMISDGQSHSRCESVKMWSLATYTTLSYPVTCDVDRKNWLKIKDLPVVTSQGRVARAPWWLRIIGSGYCKLRTANRLLARLLRTRSYLKRRAGRRPCSYGPRRPGKIQINQSMLRSVENFYKLFHSATAKKINSQLAG